MTPVAPEVLPTKINMTLLGVQRFPFCINKHDHCDSEDLKFINDYYSGSRQCLHETPGEFSFLEERCKMTPLGFDKDSVSVLGK
jgi:hypothetical protein